MRRHSWETWHGHELICVVSDEKNHTWCHELDQTRQCTNILHTKCSRPADGQTYFPLCKTISLGMRQHVLYPGNNWLPFHPPFFLTHFSILPSSLFPSSLLPFPSSSLCPLPHLHILPHPHLHILLHPLTLSADTSCTGRTGPTWGLGSEGRCLLGAVFPRRWQGETNTGNLTVVHEPTISCVLSVGSA